MEEFEKALQRAVRARIGLQEAQSEDDDAFEEAEEAARKAGYHYWPGRFHDEVRLAGDRGFRLVLS